MARASSAFGATALLLLAVIGQATESTCAPGACPAQGQILLQHKKGTWQAPLKPLEEKKSHRLVLEPKQLKNGTWVIPKELLQKRVARSATTGLTQTEKDDMLQLHNFYRCLHGAPLLTWDADIAANAQAWADNGVYEHSSSSQRMVNGQKVGENLAWGWQTRTAISSVTAWYDEIIYTDGTPNDCDDKTDPSEDICHYTAVVWQASTKIGCGKGKATETINGQTYADGDYYVCQYGPAGNVEGQFAANVVAPTQSAESCGDYTPSTPAPAPPPTPQPTAAPALGETPSGDCQDQGKDEGPLILDGAGNRLSCGDLVAGGFMSWYCQNYGFVVTKCPKSCDPHVSGGSC